MTRTELNRVQIYLRSTFGNPEIRLKPGRTRDGMCEVLLGEEFIATLHRDEDEGEVSFTLTMSILDIDLPELPDDTPQPVAAPAKPVAVEHKRTRKITRPQ